MWIDKLFDTIEKARQAASWQSAFGEPQVVEDRTIIPVAQVGYGFGLGFGSVPQPQAETETEEEPVSRGKGGGGGATAKPLGAIVVTPERVYFEPVEDGGRIALFGIGFAALFVLQLAKTLRAIFGRA
jgi:uncharacterized spore protein YtfJ